VSEPCPDEKPKSRTAFQVAVALGIIGGSITICTGLGYVLQEGVKPIAAYHRSQNDLKQLSLAIHNEQDTHGRMPGPFLDRDFSRGGVIPETPRDRLSWRVSALPYIESSPLFHSFNHSEPWDSPTNRPHSDSHYSYYADPLDGKTTLTPYRVFYDNGALWDSDPKRRLSLKDIPDGSSNTILIAESTVQVPWAQFNEHPYSPGGPLPELGRASRNTFLVAMADGSVRVVKKSVSPATLNAAITRAGNDIVGPDWD
jgi:hypothetical protein